MDSLPTTLPKPMAVSPVYDVKYRGFVHVDTEGGGLPEQPALQRAAKLLKSNQKEARAMHPLFARGLDTDLKLQVGRPSERQPAQWSSGRVREIERGKGERERKNGPERERERERERRRRRRRERTETKEKGREREKRAICGTERVKGNRAAQSQ